MHVLQEIVCNLYMTISIVLFMINTYVDDSLITLSYSAVFQRIPLSIINALVGDSLITLFLLGSVSELIV
jgi:hypothetical protein